MAQTILITGGSSGIGEAVALEYAKRGANIFLTGRNAERLTEVENACLVAGATSVQTATCDVSDYDAMQALITRWDNENPIDVVIANAGISGGGGDRKYGEPVSEARKIFDVNLYGVLNSIEPLLPRFLERRRGHIAIVSSLASFSAWPGAPSYGASKAAVRVYGEALRGMLVKTRVRVSVILPGFVVSRMTAVNNYQMPFLMQTRDAARIIVHGIDRNKSRIAFPLPTYLLSGLLGMLPDWLLRILTVHLPQKDSCQSNEI